ncbi:hypothetical protein GCM10009712_33650 [Pseudarthrobacter sulfonivorans]|uniref:pentapeptide repeat-containing protein n=1 Tax=Pseudarthrobacter sulfonivorans TaxID=121292 RepID=UPI00168B4E5B|nr:pentapeptide repeat-containing protein [Pseudarthrobacter sulfonivorans]
MPNADIEQVPDESGSRENGSGTNRSIFSALVLWSGIGIALGVIVEILFAQMASGTWLWEWRLNLDSARWYDVTRSAIATVGLFGLGGAALLAYRRQQTAEEQHVLDREKQSLELRKHYAADTTELRSRYANASAQLGHDKPAVRLAGVYAMSALAEDWRKAGVPAQQQVCVDVLCAYIRMAYNPKSKKARSGEREVRFAIIDVVNAHLQEPASQESWCRLDLDFSGATFDGADFRGAKFMGRVSFVQADFTSGDIIFNDTKFSGGTTFKAATFSGANVTFSGSEISANSVNFEHASFSGGHVLVEGMLLTAGSLNFREAKFCGSRVYFGSIFCGTQVSFEWGEFSAGVVRFDMMVTDGKISFYCARFTGARVDINAELSGGQIVFHRAKFSGGEVNFGGTGFQGTDVSFKDCSGAAPGILSFEYLRSLAHPPVVPWGRGASPSWVYPKFWPPNEESGDRPRQAPVR